MNKSFLLSLIVCLALSVASVDSFAAKRFGGGGSFGRSAPTLTQKAPVKQAAPVSPQKSQQQSQKSQASQTQPQQKPSMWRGVLGGVLAALGISALLSALGLDPSGFAGVIMLMLLAAVLFMAVKVFFGRRTVGASSSSGVQHRAAERSDAWVQKEAVKQEHSHASAGESFRHVQGSASDSVMARFARKAALKDSESFDDELAGFDSEAFLRVAKEQFKRFTHCWAEGRIEELSDFISRDVFIEVTHALRDAGPIGRVESIEPFNAEMAGLIKDGGEYVAGVRFTGRMVIGGELEEFDETWVLSKSIEGSGGWILVGIQQAEGL